MHSISDQDKRDTLTRVLGSATFGRSAQLRAFLSYICEMELSGRAAELNEYQIAVEVLDRPKDVNLSDDSSVRNRAYELRQRLEKYFSTECPDSAVRIEIPRGGYVPVWVKSETEPRGTEKPAPAEPLVPRRTGVPLWAALAAALVFAAGGWLAATYRQNAAPAEVLKEAWGPLADPNTDVLFCMATNLHLLVRPYIPERPGRLSTPPELYESFRLTRPLPAGTPLYMEPALLSVPLGEASALSSLVRTRAAFGGQYEILPEAEAPITALAGRNAFLLGTPVMSNAATFILSRQPWTVGVHGDNDFAIIDHRDKQHPKSLYVPVWRGDSEPSTVYGLLTVTTTTDSAGHTRRLVVVTGTGSSSGIQGTVEFFSSPQQLQALKARFVAAGLGGFPPNYQVAVRCVAQRNRSVAAEYAGHVVVPAKP